MKEVFNKFIKTNKNGEKERTAFDWFGVAVLASFAILLSAFLLGQIGDTYTQKAESSLKEAQMREQEVVYKRLHYVPPETDSTPEKTYEKARRALLNNDLEGILETIHPDSMWKYEDGLREAHAQGILSEAAERMTSLTEKVYDQQYVVIYETEPIPGNTYDNPLEGYREAVEFTLDRDGIWKISSI